jgi:hypothetical protein
MSKTDWAVIIFALALWLLGDLLIRLGKGI